jgi:predicted dienelactone hydrolase
VWVWYPTPKQPRAKALDYLPAEWLAVVRRSSRFPFTLLTRDVARVHAHSVQGPLAPERSRYPIVVMRGGLGAKMLDYTTLSEELASHGFVVVAFDAPYRTSLVVFPDRRVVTRPPANNPETLSGAAVSALAQRLLTGWVADTRFAMDELVRLNADSTSQFHGRLDLDAIGVAGHSLGGATAAQVCHDDARCRAGVDIDGLPLGTVARTSLGRPFMFFVSDHDTSSAEARPIVRDIHNMYERLPAGGAYWVTLRRSGHFNFSDQALLANSRVFRLLGAIGSIDPDRGLSLTGAYTSRFFEVYLEGAPQSLLSPSAYFSDLVIATR